MRIAPEEPNHEMLVALIKHRGYDPNTRAGELDILGQFDVQMMYSFIEAYKAMIAVCPKAQQRSP
jgi:hypothetical protein